MITLDQWVYRLEKKQICFEVEYALGYFVEMNSKVCLQCERTKFDPSW